jgi:hypothetical protein
MYEVLYEPLETFGGALMSNTTVVNGETRDALLTDLEEFVAYTIFVRASTSVGAGPYSAAIVEMTNESGEFSIGDGRDFKVGRPKGVVLPKTHEV